MLEPPDADAAHLDKPRKRAGGSHEEAVVMGLEMHAIVAHQASEPQQPGLRRLDDREHEP
jgi:hypothetical protein